MEGATEFLPVSSTAHLLFARNIFGIPQTAFSDTFIVAIQSGAIIAALWYFFTELKKDASIFFKIAVAFIPTALVGLLLTDFIHAIFANSNIISIALVVGGIIFLFLPEKQTEIEAPISWKNALLLGLFQVFAFIPGVSRSGALLIGGTLSRLPKKQIAAFSFLLALPTIFGATAVELWSTKEMLFGQNIVPLAVGAIVAAGVAFATINFFLRFIEQKGSLKKIGWYRIIIGILFFVLFA